MKAIIILSVLLTAGITRAQVYDATGVASTILQEIQNHLDGTSGSVQGRSYAGYGGCTDSFSVFGFLAFLLALLDLILDLQANNADNNARHLRSAERERSNSQDPTCQENAEMQQATSACYSLLRGFLNSLAAEDGECAKRFMCEGAEEAATAGPIGEVIANVASLNAGSWLSKVNTTKFSGVGDAGQNGAKLRGCAWRYSECYGLPSAYRYPAVYRGPQLPSEAYQPVLQEVMELVKDTFF